MSIQDRIKAGEFETELPYPNSDSLGGNVTYQTKNKEILTLNKRIGNLKLELRALENKMEDDYQQDCNQKICDFRIALEEEFETTDHPKKDKLWNLAWERGHSSGLSEVYCEYQELAEFIS